MSALQQFEKDEQFLRLVRRERDIDLIVAGLEIARDSQPNLEFEPTLQKLRTAISQMTRSIALAGDEMAELNILVQHMTEELNLHGDEDCYDQAESSFLNHVLETGRGIPISLSLVYMAVANELGIPLLGVSAPSHFLTRLTTDYGTMYVDPFRHGHIMTEPECIDWLHALTEIPIDEIRPTLRPANERRIIVRMLNNLKSVYGGRSQWQPAWRVQRRLALLNPGSYREKRDLALLSLRAGRPGEAMGLLEECLAVCAPDETPMLQQAVRDARRDSPRYN